MPTRYIYFILLVLFTGLVSFVVLRFQHSKTKEAAAVYPLIQGNAVDTAEWNPAKRRADALIVKIKANPADSKSKLLLVSEYINASRISGLYDYYDKASLSIVNKILEAAPSNFEALSFKSLVMLSQHHFSEALEVASAAQKVNPYSSFPYGLLVDANVELGNYKEAVEAADHMESIRPDLRSYSRISYLREIHGDLPGAIDAMARAVRAGITGNESTEWCRVQLGKLYEQTGNLVTAKFQYQLSSAARPNYPYALTGLGRIASFENKPDSAEFYYIQAQKFTVENGIREEMAEMYAATGNNKSKEIASAVITDMEEKAAIASKDPSAGHYSDKEIAHAYMITGNYEKALEYALNEYNRRPGNIEINQLVAWIYYKVNNNSSALSHLQKASITNNQNPALLFTAAAIYKQAGEGDKANNLLSRLQKNRPLLPYYLQNDYTQLMRS